MVNGECDIAFGSGLTPVILIVMMVLVTRKKMFQGDGECDMVQG